MSAPPTGSEQATGTRPAPHGIVLDGGRPPSNSFVLPQHKIVYISVTKVACTALRWMLADLAGEDPERFYEANGPHLTRLMTVHDTRDRWHVVRRLSEMSPEEVAEISVDNGWFVFAAVRDPWSRLWSAWESKLLTRHPGFVRKYGDQPWFPRIPRSPDDVVADFRTFVETHPWTTDPQLVRDSHFWPQVRSVRPDGLGYSGVYDLSALSRLVADLHAHLAGLGLDRDELYMPRANETPLALTSDVLAGGVAEQVRELYRPDFDRLGDRWRLEDLRLAEPWSPDAMRAVRFQAEVNERIGDLAAHNRRLRRELREAQRRRPGRRPEESAAEPAPEAAAATGASRLAGLTRTAAVRGRALASRVRHTGS